jgi:hypothetical protein
LTGHVIIPVGDVYSAYQHITGVGNYNFIMETAAEIKRPAFKERFEEPEIYSGFF